MPIGLLVLALVPKVMAAGRPTATRQPDLPRRLLGCMAIAAVPLSRALLAAREAGDT